MTIAVSISPSRDRRSGSAHDYRAMDFAIHAPPITIGSEVWIATDVFVAPGVRIGDCAVIGARSSVFHDIEAGAVAFGAPATVQGKR